MKRRENINLCAFTIWKEKEGIYMANAVAAREYGDQYQAMVFWQYALGLLKER